MLGGVRGGLPFGSVPFFFRDDPMLICDTELSTDVIRGLELRYPQVIVRDQLALMALWLEKNPARRPKRVIRFVENWLKSASPRLRSVPKQVSAWWTTEAGTLEQGRLMGLSARPGEDMAQFRGRIMEKIKAAA